MHGVAPYHGAAEKEGMRDDKHLASAMEMVVLYKLSSFLDASHLMVMGTNKTSPYYLAICQVWHEDVFVHFCKSKSCYVLINTVYPV